jgi:hypothetical protein
LIISSLAQSFRAGEEILLVYPIRAQVIFFGTFYRQKQEKDAKKILERSMIGLSVSSQMKIEFREKPNLLYLSIAMFRER